MYGSALGSNGSTTGTAPGPPSTGAAAYKDSFIVEKGDLSSLPPGVSRIVDGTRTLFEVGLLSDHVVKPHRLFSAVSDSLAALNGPGPPRPSHGPPVTRPPVVVHSWQVRTMQEHLDLMRSLLVRDVAYQAPIIAAYDRCAQHLPTCT